MIFMTPGLGLESVSLKLQAPYHGRSKLVHGEPNTSAGHCCDVSEVKYVSLTITLTRNQGLLPLRRAANYLSARVSHRYNYGLTACELLSF